MGKGRRTSLKRSNNQHVHTKSMHSEDSDEDYVAEADEIDDQSDELNFLVGDDSEEESCFEEMEEEEEEDDEEEEDWRTLVKPRAQKGFARSKNNGIKRPKKRRRKVTCDDNESSSDGDEEFTPNEIESLEDEEEEFSQPRNKTKKRVRTTLKRGRRKTSAKAVRKPIRKKSRKNSILRKKAKSDDEEEEFTEKGYKLRGRGKKKPAHRKKRVKSGSDSDFCSNSSNSSNSSDYEFTISEEEREQVREANELCRRLTTNLRSTRRIQEDEDEALCKPRKTRVRKGKEKAVETKNDPGKPVCGICLTEEAKNTIRGTLNCCSHYFCFACIMEWSKVESRCPLCKQRFITISKPVRCAKGFDLRSSVIQVPECDQVYQPSEEELRDFLSPYENVICTECHHGGDDALMLLCDLCDSPAHTYCVGLGHGVPEGSWYCDGCRPIALGSPHSQSHDLTPNQRTSSSDATIYGGSTHENMSEIDLNVTVHETPLGNRFLSPPRYSGGGFQAPTSVYGTGVSTVSGRRRIHDQIRALITSRLGQIPSGIDLDSLRSILGVGVASTTFQQNTTTGIGSSHRVENTPNDSVQITDHMVGQSSTSTASANNIGVYPSHNRVDDYLYSERTSTCNCELPTEEFVP